MMAAAGVVDPRWTGIIEVLVSTLGGSVLWAPESVSLRLPDFSHTARVGDLDALRLCLLRVGKPVVFEPSSPSLPDPSLAEFLRGLVRSGLMADAGRRAAA
jgi:hypothetical protein